MNDQPLRSKSSGNVSFPNIVIALGGAQSVRWNSRFAYITTASGKTVRVPRRGLGSAEKWTSFSLADIVGQ